MGNAFANAAARLDKTMRELKHQSVIAENLTDRSHGFGYWRPAFYFYFYWYADLAEMAG
jgi:hypothetical protein